MEISSANLSKPKIKSPWQRRKRVYKSVNIVNKMTIIPTKRRR